MLGALVSVAAVDVKVSVNPIGFSLDVMFATEYLSMK